MNSPSHETIGTISPTIIGSVIGWTFYWFFLRGWFVSAGKEWADILSVDVPIGLAVTIVGAFIANMAWNWWRFFQDDKNFCFSEITQMNESGEIRLNKQSLTIELIIKSEVPSTLHENLNIRFVHSNPEYLWCKKHGYGGGIDQDAPIVVIDKVFQMRRHEQYNVTEEQDIGWGREFSLKYPVNVSDTNPLVLKIDVDMRVDEWKGWLSFECNSPMNRRVWTRKEVNLSISSD